MAELDTKKKIFFLSSAARAACEDFSPSSSDTERNCRRNKGALALEQISDGTTTIPRPVSAAPGAIIH
jgi:hypothetical protein